MGFLCTILPMYGQGLGQPPRIATPASPSELEKAKAEEIQKKVEADNQATTQKIADYLTNIQKAAAGILDKDTRKILEQAAKNKNLRAILDHMRRFPADSDFLNRLKQMLLSNPTQDPAKKLDGLLRGYIEPGISPEEQKRRQQLLNKLRPELLRTMLEITAKGTGRTTGVIANISVANPTQSYLETSPQSVFIPSDGKYQPYVGKIPGTLLPPGTTNIPVDGYCADVHTPPVPSDSPMPPLDTWIPVGVPDEVPTGDDFPILSTTPAPPFVPEDIPDIINTSGFTPLPPDADQDIIITWPGTDIPVGGTLDPNEDPITFAPVIVKVMEEVEIAAESITESGILTTPFSPDPPKQVQTTIQQQVWIYASVATGEEYGKTDFTDKVYEQFEDNSGKAVSTLPEEQKEKLDSGIDDFWDVFTAVGVEAKVISETSPGIDLDPTVLATVSVPSCKCSNISYDLEVKRGVDVVYAAGHTTPKIPKVAIPDFVFEDSLDIKISNIRPNCTCSADTCQFYPAESTNPNSPNYTDPDETRPGKVDIEMSNDPAGEISENSNCKHSNKTFNPDGTEYSFALKTRDEGYNSKAVFQRLRIKAYCQLEDCQKRLCAKYIQLNFVTAN
jgi:hypothetical protein